LSLPYGSAENLNSVSLGAAQGQKKKATSTSKDSQ